MPSSDTRAGDPLVTSAHASQVPEMSKALNASGRHIAFNMCEWGQKNPWEWGDACAQSWRATKDHTGQPPRLLDPTAKSHTHCHTVCTRDLRQCVGTWESTKSIIRAAMDIPREFSGRPYGWNGAHPRCPPSLMTPVGPLLCSVLRPSLPSDGLCLCLI